MFPKVTLLLVVVCLTRGEGGGRIVFNPAIQARFPPQQQFHVRQELDDDNDHLVHQPQQQFQGATQPQQQFSVRAQSHDDGDDGALFVAPFSGGAKLQQQQFSGSAQPQQQFSVRTQSQGDDGDDDHRPQQQFSGVSQPQQNFLVRHDDDDDDDLPQQHISGSAQPRFTGLSQPQQTFVASAPRQQPQQILVASAPRQQTQNFVASAPQQQAGQARFAQQQFRVSGGDDDDSLEEGAIRVQTSQQPLEQQLRQQSRTQSSPEWQSTAYPNPAQRSEEPAKYQFDYAVRDSHSGNDFGHSETRDGDNTRGEYFVRLPDGRLQRVTYSVNGNSGFLAQVTYEGEARVAEPLSLPTSQQRNVYPN